ACYVLRVACATDTRHVIRNRETGSFSCRESLRERPMQLSHDAARALMLAAQGLDGRPTRPATKADVLETIRRMGVLQIDTIHVIARSPYMVLWSRLGDYETGWLDELLAEGALFEYWSHEASFLPIEDYPLYRYRMTDQGELGWKWPYDWMTANQQA